MAAVTEPRANTAGVVELREDAPLKAAGGGGGGGGGGAGGGGVRALVCCFAALTAAVTVALLAQVYAGDYQVVPHGAVAAGACSGAGARLLRAGGGALDAAAAAALCLAAAAPRRLSLQASGALLYWEYRTQHKLAPMLAEWGDAGAAFQQHLNVENATDAEDVPQLAAALASLHAELGKLPWHDVVQPALTLATQGSPATDTQPATLPDPLLAATLASLQRNTSQEVWAAWGARVRLVRGGAVRAAAGGGWTLLAAGSGPRAAAALQRANTTDSLESIIAAAPTPADNETEALGAGVAVADTRGTYVALVAGEPVAGPATAPLDLAPAFLVDGPVCGSRWVVGAASWRALAAAAAAARGGAGPAAAAEGARPPAAAAPLAIVLQRGDALASHADSRAGGLAERF